ncbi:MAG: hypothetical protein WC659_02540 [Patescibacteria group bacterium]
MKNYSRKTAQARTRYRTPALFRVRKAEIAKRLKYTAPVVGGRKY